MAEYEDVGRWVQDNPDHPQAQQLTTLVSLYEARREPGAYGLMIAAAEEIRRDHLSQ